MQAVDPVFIGAEPIQRTLAKDQAEYTPLPAIIGEEPQYRMTFRMRPDARELAALNDGADVMVTLLTFGRPMPPIQLWVATQGTLVVSEQLAQLLGLPIHLIRDCVLAAQEDGVLGQQTIKVSQPSKEGE